jgi:hypothetical protein
MAEFEIKLEGDEAKLGRVPARDVALLLLGAENAVMRAASVVLRRPKRAPGRGEGVVEQASRFRLQAIKEGSVRAVLELPEPDAALVPNALDFDVPSLSEMAVEEVMNTLDTGAGDPRVAGALLDLAKRVRIGERYDGVRFVLKPTRVAPRKRRRTAWLDAALTERLRENVERGKDPPRDDSLFGVLVEADFERNSARLRGPFNEVVTVAFDEALADDIQDALRRQASFEGEVAYDPETHMARSVRARRITRGTQLGLDLDQDEFWTERSFAELAAAQGDGLATKPDELFDAEATDEERDAFMAALAELSE